MNEDNFKCPGCQRREVHKRCPAYGTLFYMSGIAFTIEVEILYSKCMENITCSVDEFFNAIKSVYES